MSNIIDFKGKQTLAFIEKQIKKLSNGNIEHEQCLRTAIEEITELYNEAKNIKPLFHFSSSTLDPSEVGALNKAVTDYSHPFTVEVDKLFGLLLQEKIEKCKYKCCIQEKL